MYVKKALDVLKKENLCVNLSKCEFGNTSLIYLGHIVGEGKLKIDTSKVKLILDWPKPNNVIEVRIFLGPSQYWISLFLTFL